MPQKFFISPLLFLIAAWFASPAAAQLYADPGQNSVLETWKQSAKYSPLGYPLITLLNNCNDALRKDPYDKKSLFVRGYLLGTVGCTSWALADLTASIELDPGYAAAYAERGLCHLDLGNHALALADLNYAIQLDPHSGSARYSRGRVYLQTKNYAAALADFSSAETMHFTTVLPGELPGNFYDATMYYTGLCNELLGRPEVALGHYKRSLHAAQRYGGSGYLHRYADQPLDTTTRIATYEPGYNDY
jgi:tetratricopeptide (TPR) repeat protein